MKKPSALFLAAVTAMVGAPADPCTPSATATRKVLKLQHIRAMSGINVAKGLGLCVMGDNASGLVAVSGPAQAVQMFEEQLKKADLALPEKQVEVTGYILLGGAEQGIGTPPPRALEPAITQLRVVFPFDAYRMLDAAILRTGGYRAPATADARLPIAGRPGARYRFSVHVSEIAGDRVQFETLELSLKDWEGHDLGIRTATSIRDGQFAVIGKSNSAKPGEAIFLVVGVKLVD